MDREKQYWTYIDPKTIDKDPPAFIRISEADILKEFMPYWSKKMKKYGKESEISEDNCISDWAILRWAHKNDQDIH
jgi:hypothetical protein